MFEPEHENQGSLVNGLCYNKGNKASSQAVSEDVLEKCCPK